MASEPAIAKTTTISFTKLTIEALRQFLQQERGPLTELARKLMRLRPLRLLCNENDGQSQNAAVL